MSRTIACKINVENQKNKFLKNIVDGDSFLKIHYTSANRNTLIMISNKLETQAWDSLTF